MYVSLSDCAEARDAEQVVPVRDAGDVDQTMLFDTAVLMLP